MNRQSDRDRIAEEAVGQRHGSAPPYAEGKAGVSQEEAARQLAPSSGAQASTAEKTAESVGERVGDAYSDPQRFEQHPKSNTGRLTATGARSHNNGESNRFLSVGRKVTENLSRPLLEERFLTIVGGFALGYLTAVLYYSTAASIPISIRDRGHFKSRSLPKGNNIREASSSQQSSKP